MTDAAAANQISLETARLLLSANDAPTRASLIANAVSESLPDSACVLYRFAAEGEGAWNACGLSGDVSLEDVALPADNKLLAPLLAGAARVIYGRDEIEREDYSHLHLTRSVASIAYIALPSHEQAGSEQTGGALEVISFSDGLTDADLEVLAPVVDLALPAMLGAEGTEEERRNLLNSVHRLTQLYDLEKSLNATLDLDRVIALVPRKTIVMLGCQAIHLWLFDGGTLTVMSSSGDDPTVHVGMTQKPGEGYVADMAEEGESLLIVDAEDERLRLRNATGDTPVTTAMLVPLMQDEAEVGVLEAVNKTSGEPFDDDDQFFLNSIAETVSSSLKNASLMFAERKLEILEALVRVSSEITSTLRLGRLLQIIVNSPQNVLPFERCAIALDNRGRLQIKAISGMASIPLGDAVVEPLHTLALWLSAQSGPLHVRERDGADAEEIPPAVVQHFAATGYRALYTLPLTDDQGRVGQLIYEGSDADFLDVPHMEMIKILAGQATVAIRNALLYREVPLISLLEPLVQRKRALLRTNRSRQLVFATVAIAVLLFLLFCPLPMRVIGPATVAPQHLVTIAAPMDGNVGAVYAREGQRVSAGEVLGSMNDTPWRMELSSAEARYQTAVLTMQSDLARSAPQSGADRSQVEYLQAEVARTKSRVESTQLRSPITGIVLTPSLQDEAGEHLEAGAAFAQVLDLSTAVIDVDIPQRDAALLQAGEHAAIKLDSFPQRSFHGAVAVVSPQSVAGDGDRSFAARVPLPNSDAVLRAGMTGQAKIMIGYRPAGYVLLRRPALWFWQTLWNWIGW